MLKSNNDSFLKKNYPLILIIVGFFLVFFPFELVGASGLGDAAVFLHGLVVVLAAGFLLFYKKRKEYPARTRKFVKIAALGIPAFFAAAVLVGVAMGVSSALFTLSLEPTKYLDTDLVEKKVLDWVNMHRAQNDVGGVNVDAVLNSLAEIRSLQISQTPHEDMENASNVDINEIAKMEGIECIIHDESVNIYDYVLLFPPESYSDIEKAVDHALTYLTVEDDYIDVVFSPNATRTGINSFVDGEYLFVVQNFC